MAEELMSKKPLRKGEQLEMLHDSVLIQAPEEEKIYRVPMAIYVVWIICDGKTAVQDMCEKLSKESGVELERVKEIVIYALKELERVKLVEYV